MPSLTILGVNAFTSPSRQVHKIVKGGNHAGQRSQKSAMKLGVPIQSLTRNRGRNRVGGHKKSAAEAALVLPAASVAVAVTLWVFSLIGAAGVKLQVPPGATTVPRLWAITLNSAALSVFRKPWPVA